MNHNFINGLIKKQKGKELATYFDLKDDKIKKVNSMKIYAPFNDLFKRQQVFLEIHSYENAEDVLKTCLSVLDEGDYVYLTIKKVIRNCLVILYKRKEQKKTESLAKILVGLTKTINEIRFYTFNVLSQLYFEMNRFGLLENSLLISENTRKGKMDYYVYNLYKGITLFYLDRFKESFVSLSIAFKSKRLRLSVSMPYFLCAILNGKLPKKEVLIKYNCEFLVPLRHNVKYGLFRQTDQCLKDVSYKLLSMHIFRSCYTYIPLISLCNLIKRLYFMFSNEAKLEMNKIIEATEMDAFEIYSLLTSLIDLDLIKGYVSVNREMIVFSKVEPFPDEINL